MSKVFTNYTIFQQKIQGLEQTFSFFLSEFDKQLYYRCLFLNSLTQINLLVTPNTLLDVKTVSYWLDKDAKPLDKSYMQSAYGALINQKCVCQGYAEAYKRILDSQGITCEVICGKIRGSTEHHAWNVVSFNGKDYYHIDVTWDAQKRGSARYKYYGLTDADLRADRIWTRTSNIICNGKEKILETARLQLARSGSAFSSKGADKEYFK